MTIEISKGYIQAYMDFDETPCWFLTTNGFNPDYLMNFESFADAWLFVVNQGLV